ncbi:heparinase II/III family protein [Sandarakinorhabdus sp. AAP62]|uniref:heparinase II/III family protein n=1 Tax=Sandarakinorhabdus sp. AAP62 TaxID=1248916 RepID=UPI0002E25C3C|nr:heparinase II/III family protein [Sandarakinorhabdus sp. AAP62]
MAKPPPQPELEDEDGSLRRGGGDRGLSLTEKLAQGLTSRLYATPLHRFRLRGRFPLKLLAAPADPVPGDPHIGERIVAGRLIHAGHTQMTRDITFREAGPPPEWLEWAHGWEWLRDLAILPDREAAKRAAENLVERWLASFGEYDALGWRADLAGTRLLMALGHAPLILSSSNQIYRSAVLSAMATWARHLDRAARRGTEGLAQARALCGLYAAGTLIPGGEVRASAALAGLNQLLPVLVLPDGGIASRAPVDALALADLLIFTANAPEALGNRAPPVFADTLARLAPALRGLMLGDGQIGAWHGGAVIAPEALERLSRKTATGTEIRRGGRWSGYHRLSAGRSVVVIDAGPPPSARLSSSGHAGTLAFEMSDGPDRLITNCGGVRGLEAPLAPALASGLSTTAAHSTLVIADTNSTRIRDDGTLAAGVEEVTLALRSSVEGHLIETSHNGYARRFGMLVRRRLFLTADGNELAGEDLIEAAPAGLLRRRAERSFDVRFHLGPGVSATPTADGMGALLKTASGRIWAFKVRLEGGAGRLAIEPSVWVDGAGTIQRTQQLVVSGGTQKMAADVHWSLKRAGK